jgi:hypothetical protein
MPTRSPYALADNLRCWRRCHHQRHLLNYGVIIPNAKQFANA